MNDYIHLYMNNPTAGGVDGTMISEDHSFTAPLSAVLNATNNEIKLFKVAIRCADGFETVGNTVLSKKYYDGSQLLDTGGKIEKWKFAPDLSTAAQATFTITTNAAANDTFQIGNDTALTAGKDFAVGSAAADTATNLAAAINDKSTIYTATAKDTAVTVKERYAGSGQVVTFKMTGTLKGSTSEQVTSVPADETKMKANGVWSDTVTFADTIASKNRIFWVKVASSSDEKPQKDNSTVLYSNTVIQAV